MTDSSRTPNERELEIFYAAMEKADPAERAVFLDAACATNSELRRWVEEELRKQTSASYISGSMAESAGEPPLSPEVEALLAALKPEEPGERIGPYKLVQQLGEGGFGIVWMAEQEKPVRREVALKILKPGMDSRQIIGRFEQERQALAMLDHPGIAKVFDAGATSTGRPFFAMELVRGEPITNFCDLIRLSLRERLELFMRVCYAVQHAHQKGIIHRDLKPSNVLVTQVNDGFAIPKVIDLGLAKATLDLPSEHTLIVTQAERMIGTPLYMSPEQAEGSPDLDTRTDIYSLGVILFELLTGRTPHDPTELARHSHDQIRHAIREQDPARPSSVLRGLSSRALSTAAQFRGSDAPQLIRGVRGELDAICMKALEKDRRRRYSSAAALASDIQSHLLNEPISARPPSQWYRIQKFAQRNRRTVLAVTTIVLTIFLGALVSVREALRAKAAEHDALTARERETRQRQQAEEQRTSARLNEYVADINLAQQSLNAGNLGRAVQLLEKHRPQPGEADQRGWSWRYLWRLAQGEPHVQFPDHPGPGNAVAVSRTGTVMAVGGRNQISIYDTNIRRVAATLSTGAESLAFLADDKELITMERGRLQLWNTADWTEYASWLEADGTTLVVSPNGERLIVAGHAGLRIYETKTWTVLRSIENARAPVAFAPDGRTFAAETDSGITLWSIDDAIVAPKVMTGSAQVFAQTDNAFFHRSNLLNFASAGGTIVAAQNNGTDHGIFMLRVWNTQIGQEIATLPEDPERTEHTGAITSLAVSPDGKTFATTSLDHSVRLWGLEQRRRASVLTGHRAEVVGAGFTPDGHMLFTCDRLGQVKAWTIPHEKHEEILSDVHRVLGVSPDGRTLAVIGPGENAVTFYNAETKEMQRQFILGDTPNSGPPLLALSADLRTLVHGLDNGQVKLWNTETKETRVLSVSDTSLHVLALTPDGQTLIFGSRGRHLHTHDLRTSLEQELPFSASSVVLSPDGSTLAAYRRADFGADNEAERAPVFDGGAAREPLSDASDTAQMPDIPNSHDSVVLWDLSSGKIRTQLARDRGVPLAGAFSPDGHIFATAGIDNVIRLWETSSGVPLGVCTGHKQIVRALSFSYDGNTLATTGDDRTLRLWNVKTQQEILYFQDLNSSIADVLFSPDDTTLLIGRTTRGLGRNLLLRRATREADTRAPGRSH